MVNRFAGRSPLTALLAVVQSLLNVVDIKTKALAMRLLRIRQAKLSGLSLLNAWRVSAMPMIAGGVGEDGNVKDQVKAALAEALPAVIEQKLGPVLDQKLKPIGDRLGALEGKVEAVDREAVRVDATGKQFKFPGGDTAPAHVRSVGGDSRPLMLVNLFKLVADPNDTTRAAAKEELEFSRRLKAVGYSTSFEGGILIPFWEDAIPDEHKELRAEAKSRWSLGAVDPGQLAWLAKRYPAVAREMGLTTKDLQLGDDTLGGYLIPAVLSDRVIDLLRNRSVVARAGATEIPLPPAGNITYPKLTADPVFTWRDPDSTTDMSTSNLNFGVIRLIAKDVVGAVTVPNDLIRFAIVPVETWVRTTLAMNAAIAEDSAFLEGVGSSLKPKGILNYPLSANNTPAVGKITRHDATTAGANGDTLEPEDVRLIQAFYEAGNDPDPATAWIMRPLVWAGLTNARADAVSAGDKKGPFLFLSEADLRASGQRTLQNVPVLTSMQASHNRAKGSGTDLDYTLYGNFRRVIIGRSGALELAASEHIKFLQDKTVIRAVLRSDSGLEHEESFVLTDNLEGFLP